MTSGPRCALRPSSAFSSCMKRSTSAFSPMTAKASVTGVLSTSEPRVFKSHAIESGLVTTALRQPLARSFSAMLVLLSPTNAPPGSQGKASSDALAAPDGRSRFGQPGCHTGKNGSPGSATRFSRPVFRSTTGCATRDRSRSTGQSPLSSLAARNAMIRSIS